MNAKEQKIMQLMAHIGDHKNRLSIPRIFLELTQDHRKAFVLWDCFFKSNHSHCKSPYTFYVELKFYAQEFYIAERTLRRYLDEWEQIGWMKKRKQRNIYSKDEAGNKIARKVIFISFDIEVFANMLLDQTDKMSTCPPTKRTKCPSDSDQTDKMSISLLTDTSITDTSITDAEEEGSDSGVDPVGKQLQKQQQQAANLVELKKQGMKNWIQSESSKHPLISQVTVLVTCRNDPDIIKTYQDKNLFLKWNDFDEFYMHLSEKARHKGITMSHALFKSWIVNERPVSIQKMEPHEIYNADQKMRYREYRSYRLGTNQEALGIDEWFAAKEPSR